jgi:hypothetical protein
MTYIYINTHAQSISTGIIYRKRKVHVPLEYPCVTDCLVAFERDRIPL